MVKTLPSNAGNTGSTPGQRTKILHAAGCGQKFKLIKKIVKKKRIGNIEDRIGGYMQSRTNHCESQKSKNFLKIK